MQKIICRGIRKRLCRVGNHEIGAGVAYRLKKRKNVYYCEMHKPVEY